MMSDCDRVDALIVMVRRNDVDRNSYLLFRSLKMMSDNCPEEMTDLEQQVLEWLSAHPAVKRFR